MATQPTTSEAAGRYQFSSSKFGGRVDAEILSKANDAYIELKADGRVVFFKVPIVPDSPNRTFVIQEFRSGSGTFEISAMGMSEGHDIYGAHLHAGESPEPMEYPWFKRKGQALILSFQYFDGDFVERLVFTRSP